MVDRPYQTIFRSNDTQVERRFLLFQLDLKNPEVQSFCGDFNPFTNQRDSSGNKQPFKIVDPLDYEDAGSPLYWRNVLAPDYQETFKSQLQTFRSEFFSLVAAGGFRLKSFSGRPFRDISAYVNKTSGYSYTINDFSNLIELQLAAPDLLAESGIVRGGNVEAAKDLQQDLDIKENDILMVRVSRDQGKTFKTEYLGRVTTVEDGSNYGTIDSLVVKLAGTSKDLFTTSIIQQGAVNDQQFLIGVEVNTDYIPSVFENRFNSLNNKQIFSKILNEQLGLKAPDKIQGISDPNITPFFYPRDLFNGTDTRGFQSNIFVLLLMYLIDTTEIDPADPLVSRFFPQSKTGAIPSMLDTPVRAFVQHGDHSTFNLMVADGFKDFYSQISKPSDILSDVRAHSFYELFETRNGTLICRPHRYNKLEETVSDVEVKNVDPSTIQTVFQYDAKTSTWRYQKNADFFIQKEELSASISIEKDDLQLDTRTDVQWSLPTVGVQEYPGGSFTDPNLLIKYGLRAKPPINNPNVLNPNLAKLFAPIAQGINNAETRRAVIPLWDIREYRGGKLYYLESENMVGYAVACDIDHQYGKLGNNVLQMVMVRRVVERPISEILKNENELVNFAMCYLADPTASKKTDPKAASTLRQTLVASAKEVLNAMLDVQVVGPSVGVKVLMYRYVPNILDLIIDVEDAPALGTHDVTTETKQTAEVEKARRVTGMKEALTDNFGQFYATQLLRQDGRSYEKSLFDRVANDAISSSPFFPGVGAYLYNKQKASLFAGAPKSFSVFESGQAFQENTAISVPLFSDEISSNPNNFTFSQFLINRLGGIDLGMKFNSSNTMNVEGFPQLYGAVNRTYRLFGSVNAPRDFIQSLNPTVKTPLDVYGFQDNIFNTPNALKLNLGSAPAFVNDFFRVKSVLGQRFNLPCGHFIYKDVADIGGPTISGKLRVKFVGIPGGLYEITPTQGENSYHIRALGVDNKIAEDIAATTSWFSFPAPVSGVTISGGSASEVPLGITQELTITAPDGLYFISPFTDMTLERMMEFGLDPGVAGYRKQDDVARILHTSNKALLGDNDLHASGQALDLCPEFLTYSSGSDLEVPPGSQLFSRLKGIFMNFGFKDSDIKSLMTLTNNSIKIHWKYLDSTPGVTSPAPAQVYYHLGVLDKEVTQEMNKQRAVNLSNVSDQTLHIQTPI